MVVPQHLWSERGAQKNLGIPASQVRSMQSDTSNTKHVNSKLLHVYMLQGMGGGLQTSGALSPSSSSGSMAAPARSSGACCLLPLPEEVPVMDSGPLIDRSSLLWPVKACPLALLQLLTHTHTVIAGLWHVKQEVLQPVMYSKKLQL